MTLPRRVLPHQTYLVTRRCIGRRFLLRPDDALNNVFIYCLGLAAPKYGVLVHALSAMSNHYHLVLTDVEGMLPDFMAWLNRQLAMCIKRLRGWDEVVWEPNVAFSAVELVGPSEVLDKVAYVLLNPVSAGLVRSTERWPGALSTLRSLHSGFRTEEATFKRCRRCYPPAFRRCAPSFVARAAATSAAPAYERRSRSTNRPPRSRGMDAIRHFLR
jgi:REP element-mobilizing transposase RayT